MEIMEQKDERLCDYFFMRSSYIGWLVRMGFIERATIKMDHFAFVHHGGVIIVGRPCVCPMR